MPVHNIHTANPYSAFQFTSADGLQIASARWDGRAPVHESQI